MSTRQREHEVGPIRGKEGPVTRSRFSTEQVWRAIADETFAVLSYSTPAGEPRSSGVMFKVLGRRLFVAVAADSWKARHVAASGQVAVTVLVRRGGILSLVAPIPPATISFHAKATVHAANSLDARALRQELASLLPAERQDSGAIIEIEPVGTFVTYAVGVPLRKMRDTVACRARVPVS
jgi:hypothetical protein